MKHTYGTLGRSDARFRIVTSAAIAAAAAATTDDKKGRGKLKLTNGAGEREEGGSGRRAWLGSKGIFSLPLLPLAPCPDCLLRGPPATEAC